MKCPGCGADSGEGKFCRKCGAPLNVSAGLACQACGAQVRPGAKFCLKCGAPQAEAAPVSSETQCAHCGSSVAPTAKFCKSCGTPRDAAVERAATIEVPVAESRAASTGSKSTAVVEPALVSPPAAAVPVKPPIPISSPSLLEPHSTQAESQHTASKKPMVLIVTILVLLIGGAVWWFVGRLPSANKAPIVKGPLYSVPAGSNSGN